MEQLYGRLHQSKTEEQEEDKEDKDEYMDCLKGLDNTFLPPKEAFSRLNNEDISDEDCASCQKAWRENGMTTLRDFLVWNNNRGVVPFLLAIHREFAFYEHIHVLNKASAHPV